MISHHPNLDLQFEYATGTLTEPFALAVASHMALCEQCSSHLFGLNTVGGMMLDDIRPVEMSDQALESALTALDGPVESFGTTGPALDAKTLEVIPEPLRRYLSQNLTDFPWNHVSDGIDELRLPLNNPEYRVSLVRLEPGCTLPAHRHTKEELTVVLSGGFTDGEAHFERGDFSHLDSTITHSPVANPDSGCMALGVLSGPIELTGWLGSLMNPLLRF